LTKRELVGPRGNGHGSRNDQKRDRHPILKLNAKNTDSLDEDMQSRFLSITLSVNGPFLFPKPRRITGEELARSD
jgi:hypothetical protein